MHDGSLGSPWGVEFVAPLNENRPFDPVLSHGALVNDQFIEASIVS